MDRRFWRAFLPRLSSAAAPAKRRRSSFQREGSKHGPEQLHVILATPGLRKSFYGHLEREHANENLEFMFWVNKYRSRWETLKPSDVRALAVQIYRHFISLDGEAPVNISAEVSKALKLAIMESKEELIARNVFEDAVGEITVMLERDGLQRFVATPSYKMEVVVAELGL